jgi:hypothetical protein
LESSFPGGAPETFVAADSTTFQARRRAALSVLKNISAPMNNYAGLSRLSN